MAKQFANISRKLDKVQLILGAIFSLLFSATIVLGRMISYHNNIYGFFDENYIRDGKISDLILFIVLGVIIFSAVTLLMKNWPFLASLFVTSTNRVKPVKFAIIAGLIIAICWLPYILALAPGSVLEDSYYSIHQMMAYGHPTSNDHPIFYTLFVGVCCKIGVLINDINLGVFIYSIIQSLLMIFTMVYGLKIMYEHKVAMWVLAICIAYFSLLPIFPFYGMIMWKDPLFSCALLWMSMLIFRKVMGEDIQCWRIKYFLACLLCVLFRNNGLYVVCAMTLFVAIFLKKDKLMTVGLMIMSVLLLLGFRGFAKSYWHTNDGQFVESIGIMLQQMAYCISVGDELSQESMDYLNSVLPIDEWAGAYEPCKVDSIKWHQDFSDEFLEDNQEGIYSCWLDGLKRYTLNYLKAYILNTQGYWRIDAQNSFGYAEGYIYDCEYNIKYYNFLPEILSQRIRGLMIYIPTGVWLFSIILACILTLNHGFCKLLVFLPAILCWGTIMVAAPIAFSLRLVFILALGFPFYVTIPIAVESEEGGCGDK